MDEITLIHAGLAWDVENFIFCYSGCLKIYHTHKYSNTCHGLNFYRKDIFLNAPNNVRYDLSESITIENSKQHLFILLHTP